MSFSLYNRFRQLEKVRVDKDASSDYLGAAGTSGALRTSAPLSYTDGGDYVTLGITQADTDTDGYLSSTDWDTFNGKAAASHAMSTHSDEDSYNISTSGTATIGGTVTIPTGLTGLIRADSGVLSVDADVTDVVSVASTTAAGKVEIAIASEVNTGTSTALAVSPDSLEGSNYGKKAFCIAAVEHDTAVTVVDGKIAFTVPAELDTMSLVDVVASVHTKGITGTTDIQIRRRRAGSDADMLSTKITIGDEFFATDEAVEADNDDVATGDQIYIDVDAIHSGTAPNGLSVTCTFAVTTVGV